MVKNMEEKKEEKKKPSLIEAIAGSEIFIALATKNYLQEMHNPNSEVSIQAGIAKKLNKPVVILMAKTISQTGKLEIERFFVGYNVIKVIDLDFDDYSSWKDAAEEIGQIAREIHANKVLARTDFIRINLDKLHYYYSFKSSGIEICIEPCAGGFCVAAYNEDKTMLESRKCTNCDGYLDSYQAIFGERREDTWTKALVIANELYRRFIVETKNGEKEEHQAKDST